MNKYLKIIKVLNKNLKEQKSCFIDQIQANGLFELIF